MKTLRKSAFHTSSVPGPKKTQLAEFAVKVATNVIVSYVICAHEGPEAEPSRILVFEGFPEFPRS